MQVSVQEKERMMREAERAKQEEAAAAKRKREAAVALMKSVRSLKA